MKSLKVGSVYTNIQICIYDLRNSCNTPSDDEGRNITILKKGEAKAMVKKITIPDEFRAELAITGWTSMMKGFLYVVRERHGAAEAYACAERFFEMDDRIKNMTNFLKTVFKIEGNDAATIMDWLVIWYEILGFEYEVLERSKAISRNRITKCPFKTGYKDIGEWCNIWSRFVVTTINPKATSERLKGMCAGDSYCESITRIEE